MAWVRRRDTGLRGKIPNWFSLILFLPQSISLRKSEDVNLSPKSVVCSLSCFLLTVAIDWHVDVHLYMHFVGREDGGFISRLWTLHVF